MRLIHLTTALLIPAFALGPAQTPEATAPTLKVYSRETIVDVTVTDNKGNPVHGLTQSDFTVKEDHKPQPIRSFHEYTAATPATTATPPPKLPPNTYTNLQPPPASSATNILLLDGLNTAPPDASNPAQVGWSFTVQTRVEQGAVKYLQTMPAGTRVVVLNLSRNLRVLQGPTSDPALLSAAVNTMEINMDGRATWAPPPAPLLVEIWCTQQVMRNRATLEALNQIAASAAAIKGKKNLIWFSAGFPTITDAASRPKCIPDYESDLTKTYALLAAAQVTVYPIGARGLGLPIPNPFGPGPLIDQSSPTTYGIFTSYELLSFESMAEATGGEAFYNSNDIAGEIAHAVAKASDYYTLSYVPPGTKYNWAHHSIDISVSNPDHPNLHLVYRTTYDAVDPATIKPAPGLTLTTTPPEVRFGNMSAAMSRSMPTSQDILFDVQVEPSTAPAAAGSDTILGTLDPTVKAKLKGKPLARYSFSYSIPAAQLTFTPQPDGSHKGQTELDLAAFDTDGKLVTGLSQTITMPLTDARYQQFIKGPFRFTQQLDLPPGQLFLRIGVLDHTSNKVGTLEIPLTVPKK